MSSFDYRWRPLERLISVEDYRLAAAKRVPRLVWEYVEGGADDLVTVRRNEEAFLRWSLRARMMTAHAEPRLSTAVAGVVVDRRGGRRRARRSLLPALSRRRAHRDSDASRLAVRVPRLVRDRGRACA